MKVEQCFPKNIEIKYLSRSTAHGTEVRPSGYQITLVRLDVEIEKPKGKTIIVDRDEGPRDTSYEVLAKMKPAFQKDGTTTVGNASIISDGAAAVVVTSRQKAEALGCEIMASVGAQGGFSHNSLFGRRGGCGTNRQALKEKPPPELF